MSSEEISSNEANQENEISDKFPAHHQHLLHLIVQAVYSKSLSLMRCTNKAGEERSVICIAQPDPMEEGGMTFVPLGELIEDENVYAAYTPPSVVEDRSEDQPELPAATQEN